jgi:hypothetical protein
LHMAVYDSELVGAKLIGKNFINEK